MDCCRWTAAGTLLLASLLLSSRIARSEEDRDSLWDAWGSWSECSRTCGGGASYSLRRCLSSKSRGSSRMNGSRMVKVNSWSDC